MSPSTVYLVTGANRSRGIGFGIVAHILAKHDNAFVYAGARDPDKATALIKLKEKYPGRFAIVKCVSADSAGNASMAKEIEERHGRVDTVIANAGIFNAVASVHQAAVKDLEEHFKINVVGPIVLFQSVYELLKKSANPRFIPMSSPGGSISGPIVTFDMGTVIYASTKATLNWVTRKIHFENKWLVSFPMSPGEVSTDLLENTKAMDDNSRYDELMKTRGDIPTAEQAAISIMKVIDESTREKNGGEFMHLDGTKLPW